MCVAPHSGRNIIETNMCDPEKSGTHKKGGENLEKEEYSKIRVFCQIENVYPIKGGARKVLSRCVLLLPPFLIFTVRFFVTAEILPA